MNRNKLTHVLVCCLLFSPELIYAASFKHHAPQDPKMLLVMLAFCGVVLLVAVGYLSLCLVFSVVQPDLLRRGGEFMKGTFLKNLLTGLLISIVYILLLGIINQFIPSNRAIRVLFAAPILSLLFIHGLFGFSMVAHSLGDKIHSNINSRYIGSTFMAVFAGGGVLILTGLIPFAGPVCFVVVNLAGIGLATRTIIGIKRKKKVKTESPENKLGKAEE